jgi:excisionase family DNA binding protein
LTTTIEREWLSYREATELTGLSRTRLWELLRDGSIAGVKDGKRVRINRASIHRYLQSIPWQSTLPGV